jgi:hypothetical protein
MKQCFTIQTLTMMKVFLPFLLLGVPIAAISQTPVFAQYIETVGNPSVSASIMSYSGWTNQSGLIFTGSAEVQYIDTSSGYHNASGGGNIFLTNTPGAYFQISNFPQSVYHVMSVSFGMLNDTINPGMSNDLKLEVSLDSGLNWRQLSYFNGNTRWGHFDAGTAVDPTNPNMAAFADKVLVRFTQTSITRIIRIDDIHIEFSILLSIKLSTFSAKAEGGKAILSWKAFTSNNKDAFVVEKSKNGEQFLPIAQLSAKGDGEYSYEHIDEMCSDKAFYRLQMIDADGKKVYSKVQVVGSTAKQVLIQSVYPIPANGVLNIQLNTNLAQRITFLIANAKGQLILQKNVSARQGIAKLKIDLSFLEAGVYYLTATSSESSQTRKFVVTK